MSPEDFAAALRDCRRSGIYNLPREGVDGLRKAATLAEFPVFEISLDAAKDKDGLLQAIAHALDFPEWFGANWDALEECINDLSWLDARNVVLLLTHCDRFAADQRQDFLIAADIFNTAAAVFREEGRGFWVFADLHPNGVALLPSLT